MMGGIRGLTLLGDTSGYGKDGLAPDFQPVVG
jgi:hypothetical protein